MKKIVVLVVVLALAVVLFVVALGDQGEEERCTPGIGGGPMTGGVPTGEMSLPQAGAMAAVTSEFGPRWGTEHQGIDIAQGAGTPIYALADGVVAAAGEASGFGQWIVLDHNLNGERISTVYGHMFAEGVHVKAGDEVAAGQHIADEGYNGHVDPPGPGGSHLHFEVWTGGRLTGGQAVNPRPWLEKAVEPGTAGETSDPEATAPTGTTELAPDPRLNETNLQINAVKAGRGGAANFPVVEVIGGWRSNGGAAADHPEGRAVDFMIPQWETSEGKELGDEIVGHFLSNAEFYDVEYLIWRQYISFPDGTGYQMEDRGSPSENHFDHVHVSLNSSPMAVPGQELGAGPVGGSAAVNRSSADPECETALGAVDDSLHTSEGIPPELLPWIERAGGVCPEVSSALVAGLMEQESGFSPSAVSHAGALGYAQFMPGTWAQIGAEVNENGEVEGPAGSGSPSDPGDASMAAARYLCSIAEDQKPQILSGEIEGDPVELMLAGYNAGPGNVTAHGGVPPFAETQKYVKIVPEKAAKYGEVR
ncbi:peptidoglycan DD-metalloendopeptidase family protein [Luteococcus sp.]|uniref:peptidoglycan DD-metalloendopeptidase family protein n=1 Tax=Luteococcus sp. TaxID=1969402 RepID=UPI003736DDAA